MAIWQLSRRTLKWLKGFSIGLSVLGFFYILPALLLQIPAVQSWAGQYAARELSSALGTELRLERISMEGWRQLHLKNLNILDSLGRPALSARSLRAGVYPMDWLFRGKKELSSLRFFGLELLIDIDSVTGRSNVQHIIDALSSEDDSPSSLELNLSNILMRDARLDLLNSGSPWIRFDSINLKIDELDIKPDSLRGQINELSLRSNSGFRLKDMQSTIRLRGDSLSLTAIEAYLPNSYLNIPELRLLLGANGLSLIQELRLKGLSLAIKDITSLYQPLKAWESDTLLLSAHITRSAEQMQLQDVEASLMGKAYLNARSRLTLNPRGQIHTAGLDIQRLILSPKAGIWLLSQIQASTNNEQLSQQIQSLGQLSYQGTLDIDTSSDLKLQGKIKTDLGVIDTEATLRLEGKQLSRLQASLGTQGFNLNPLQLAQLGLVAGDIKTELFFPTQSDYPVGEAQVKLHRLAWQDKEYRDISAHLKGHTDGKYTVALSSSAEDLPLTLNGDFTLKKGQAQDLHFWVKTENFPLRHFHRELDKLSLQGEINATSLNLNDIAGAALFPVLRLNVNGKPLDLSHINVDMHSKANEHILRLTSPWVNLRLFGQYQPEHIWRDALATLAGKVPALKSLIPKRQGKGFSQAELELELDSLPQSLREMLQLPIEFKQKAELRAKLDSRYDSLAVALLSPEVLIGQHRVHNFSLNLQDKQLLLGGDAFLYGGTQLIGASIGLNAFGENLSLSANLGRDSLGTEQGALNIKSQLSPPSEGVLRQLRDIQARVQIEPSRLRVHTHQWDIAPASIAYNRGALQVAGLSLSTEGRHLAIDGAVGSWAGDNSMRVRLRNINLRYILEAAGVYFDLLDTDLSGLIEAKLQGKHLLATAAVRSPHFYVNKQDVGAIDIGLNFSTEDLYIKLKGDVLQSHGGRSQVDGWIKPAQGAGIDLSFDAQRLNVGFIGSFMDGFLSHLGGYGTGRARLHGLFERGVTVSGEAQIDEGKVGVRALGTNYSFAHRLMLEDERIHLDGIRLYDDEGHSALLRGSVRHRCFDNFDINLRAEDMKGIKVMQTNSPKLMPAYGTAYASGYATMQGSDSKLNIQVDAISEAGTDVTLDFNTMTAGKDERLMRFVPLRPERVQALGDSLTAAELSTASIIDLNLKIQITPSARLALRMGEDNNSTLVGQAEGVLNISAPAVGNPEVYGTLAVIEGEYLFNLQQLALKRFLVKEGGHIAFRGDAMRASLNNLNAVYALTANISDLDESISRLSQRTNIPVHCLMNLSGEVSKPQIRLSLELPGVDTEIERRVRSLLNTPDAVTRQMLYLIALGKFYTSDAETRSSTTTNNWTSVASSALSEQLSSLLGGLSEHIRLGTSIKTKSTAFDDTDIELNFSSSFLGNRLLINGNVGYHDNPYLNGQYLGEFDFEYKLNRSGSFRLKGYNRYNTMYQYLRQSFLTQGFGLLYRQRFDSLSDLLRPSRHREKLDSLRSPVDSLP